MTRGGPGGKPGASVPTVPGTNTGCGHVYPRPDGQRMRCGGPRLCPRCRVDADYKAKVQAAEKAVVAAAMKQHHGAIDPDSAAALDAECEQLAIIRTPGGAAQ